MLLSRLGKDWGHLPAFASLSTRFPLDARFPIVRSRILRRRRRQQRRHQTTIINPRFTTHGSSFLVDPCAQPEAPSWCLGETDDKCRRLPANRFLSGQRFGFGWLGIIEMDGCCSDNAATTANWGAYPGVN
ncbi:hypothetical protein ZHAS_00022227 [Anopheles sinensis]|uniref:Uncharacterized protein n=1 Tax=Anopheles sinensis TaxID=74873 RepID=A0A084WUT2_ANOSI|nr:hypothetical protein ZHAS_00022227 [Anopheles sinensis]